SARYRAAAQAADRQVQALAASWGERGPLVVLSDHGHMPRGGHGGTHAQVRRAFLLLAGPGVRPGLRLPDASTTDVAPTLAALLGVAAPAQALGSAILGALALDDRARGARLQAESARLALVGPLAEAGRGRLARAERRAQV